MHEYTVELRVSGAELVPAHVTQALGLEPCTIREAGKPKSKSRVWKESVWGYNGFPEGPAKHWASLEDGLTFVLDRVEPLRSQIEGFKQSCDIFWWCGHFQSSFDGGPLLSAGLLRRLGDFGADLYIDNYLAESPTE